METTRIKANGYKSARYNLKKVRSVRTKEVSGKVDVVKFKDSESQ